jgi:integrase
MEHRHPQLRTALDEWLGKRATWPDAVKNIALFLNHRGGRLATRGAYDELRAITNDAGLEVGRDAEFTPHVLRHTAGTNLIRDGQDVVLVAEILGQSLETTLRYSLPTDVVPVLHAAGGRRVRPGPRAGWCCRWRCARCRGRGSCPTTSRPERAGWRPA